MYQNTRIEFFIHSAKITINHSTNQADKNNGTPVFNRTLIRFRIVVKIIKTWKAMVCKFYTIHLFWWRVAIFMLKYIWSFTVKLSALFEMGCSAMTSESSNQKGVDISLLLRRNLDNGMAIIKRWRDDLEAFRREIT